MARLITRMNRGGPARTIVRIEPLLRERGVESLLIVGQSETGEDDLCDEAEARGLNLRRIPHLVRRPDPRRDLRARREIRQVLSEFAPDLVHTHTFKAGLLARSLPRTRGERRVHTFHGHVFHGYYSPLVSRGLVTLERWLARRTDRLITVAPALRAELAYQYRIAAEARIDVIPGIAIDEPDLAEEPVPAIDGEGPVIGCVARLVPIKAPLRFLELAEQVSREAPAVRFVWVGDGPLREDFLAERDRRGLDGIVSVVGWQERTGPWHRRFDVEVLLSDSEGLPVSLLEARRAGTPVVATSVGGVPDLVTDGEDGFLVAPADVTHAARRVLELLGDPDRAAQFASRARQRDASSYTVEAHVERLLAVYHRLLGTGSPSRMPVS